MQFPSGVLGALVRAILTGVIVFIVILVIAYILNLIPVVAGIGAILQRFALILALLAGAAAFFSGWRSNS
jgi:hypothetical protein